MSAVLAGRTRPLGALALVLIGVVLLAVPLAVPDFYVFVATRILIFGLFATAFNVVFGFGGMPSLGHAAFFGLGGYTVALGVTRWEWSFPAIVVVALVLGAAVGAVFGLFNLRTRGIYLLLLSLALAQAIYGLAFQQVELTGGDNGIAGVTRDGLPSWAAGAGGFYWFTLVVVGLSIALLWTLTRSPFGMAIVGMRESESRMGASGYRVSAYRVLAFTVSGAFSALAGTLEVYLQGSVSPSSLSWLISAEVMIFAILGGAAYFFGPFLGATLVLLLEVYVSTWTARWTVVLALIYILTALFLRDGILGRSSRLWRAFRRRRAGERPPGAEGATETPIPDAAPRDHPVMER